MVKVESKRKGSVAAANSVGRGWRSRKKRPHAQAHTGIMTDPRMVPILKATP